MRKTRSSTSAGSVNFTMEEVIRYIDRLSGPDKERCKNALLKRRSAVLDLKIFCPRV